MSEEANQPARDKLLGYGPQGLALEVNPWQTKKSVEAVLLYRGAIVAGWANVEATLIEVAIRLSYLPEYHVIRESYPYRRKSRVNFLRAAFDVPGPLLPYAKIANCILNKFEETADLRSLMAHGGMTILSTVKLRVYKSKSSDEVTMMNRVLTETEMLNLARSVTRFSRAVRHLYHKLDQIAQLPPLDPQ